MITGLTPIDIKIEETAQYIQITKGYKAQDEQIMT
jgi:hypothetical protein